MLALDELLVNEKNIDQEMIEASIDFWFSNKDEIRSPFPDYIKSDLLTSSIKQFVEWNKKISDEARKELNDEILVERFEEFLFEQAHKMVMTEDERITIKYPFMLRIDDQVKHEEKPLSKVIARNIVVKDDTSYLEVELSEVENGIKWSTSFELME
jgi:hypothetical protein